MKILTTLLLTCILLLASCSKSLTDIGYKGGPTDTFAYRAPTFNSTGMDSERSMLDGNVGNGYIFNEPRGMFNRRGTGTIKAYYYIDNAQLSYMAIERGTKFLDKFYKSLTSAKFNTKKFTDKYLPLCTIDVESTITEASASSKSPKGGWEVFLPSNTPNAANYTINYDKNGWFKVNFADKQSMSVKLFVDKSSSSPIICDVVDTKR